MTSRNINWTGIGFGFGLMALAAYQQLKLPPALSCGDGKEFAPATCLRREVDAIEKPCAETKTE